MLPNRKMIEEEFDIIWKKQALFNPSLYSNENAEYLKQIIFYQRRLKPVEPGKCRFFPEENRIAKAHPLFQRFRIMQELNNLSWRDNSFSETKLLNYPEARYQILQELLKKRELSFNSMRKILTKLNLIFGDETFNLEDEKRKLLKGDETASAMSAKPDAKKAGIGSKWHDFSELQQHQFITLLLDDDISDENLLETHLPEKFNLTPQEAENCLLISLPKGYGTLSEKAIRHILPILEDQGLSVTEAIEEAGLKDTLLSDDTHYSKLPYYGKILDGDVTGGNGKPDATEEQRFGTIPNPTVHIGLNRVRAVINDLIKEMGKPHQIVIELARDLPLGAQGKLDVINTQSKNQKKNEIIQKTLKLNVILSTLAA